TLEGEGEVLRAGLGAGGVDALDLRRDGAERRRLEARQARGVGLVDAGGGGGDCAVRPAGARARGGPSGCPLRGGPPGRGGGGGRRRRRGVGGGAAGERGERGERERGHVRAHAAL